MWGNHKPQNYSKYNLWEILYEKHSIKNRNVED